MNHHNARTGTGRGDRGVALVMTLLLLSLLMVMTLSMVIAMTSDTLIDAYYRNARGSFYAADSGINAARATMISDIQNGALPSGYTPANGAPGMLTPSITNVTSSASGFGAYNSMLGGSTSSSYSSWPGTFQVSSATLGPQTVTYNGSTVNNCTPIPACLPTSTAAITAATTYTYYYNYSITANGQSRGGEVNTITETGVIAFPVKMNPSTTTTTSFAAYGTLFDQYALCSASFVPGMMSGKFFSNQSWNFGSSGVVGATKYVFTGDVGAVNNDVGYIYSDGTCDQNNKTTDTHKGVTVDPTFSGGLTLGQQAIPLPANSYNHLSAVLDGLGDCPPAPASCSAPSNAQMAVLTNAAGTSWSSSATTGVFMPYTITGSGSSRTKTLNSNAGGIYVQGTANSVTLAASTATVSGATHNLQVITIEQGSGGSAVTTTVTLDLTGGTTTISDSKGNSTGAMAGLPENLNNSPASEACLVYVNGNISSNPSANAPTGLSGPSSGAAIQNGSAVLVASTGTISITGSLTYSTEPVTLNSSDSPVSPVPTNVLGIYTSGGNVQLQPPSNVSSMEIDASLAEMASGQSYGMIAQWNQITTLNIVGGRVQNEALSGASLTARNIYFDQRFANGFAPPWFPTTTVTSTTSDTAVAQPATMSVLSWSNTSAQ